MHLPQLIIDLAIILAAAGVTTLVFRKFKQPMVLGYLLAGLLVGPQIALFPTISDQETISTWGEIGVIILLFSLGLEFSFKRLVKLGGSALITGSIEIFCLLLTGYLLGQIFGWSTIDSLFLGGIIAISSTTIILKSFEELGLKQQKFAGLVMGVLVVEDLVAVLLLVLLSTVAISNQFASGLILWSVYKLVLYLSLWFFGGIYLLPTFFRWAKRIMNDEGILVTALGLCFSMVLIATNAGFSPALGAFTMGSIIAETNIAERIEKLIQPLKNLFGAVFFVSVGMLIDPNMLLTYAWPVIFITLTVIIGKSLFVSIGSLVSGQPLKQSIQTGLSMAQIGEFSFIIAALGESLKVTSGFLYPIAVGVAVITAFSTPFTMKLALPVYRLLERKTPEKVLSFINRYSAGTQTITAVSHWKEAIQSYLLLLLVNSLMVLGMILLTTKYFDPFLGKYVSHSFWFKLISTVVKLAFMAPFLWALTIKKIDSVSYKMLWLNNQYNKGPLLFLALLRVLVGILLVGFLLDQQYSAPVALTIAVGTIIIGLIIFSKRLQKFYHRLEDRFLLNFHEKEKKDAQRSGHQLIPWDAHLANYVISPEVDFVGKTLEELAFRESLGINIAMIERGEQFIYAPNRFTRLFPGDRIAVIGTDVQLEEFSAILEEAKTKVLLPKVAVDISLEKIAVNSKFPFKGQTIRDSQIREKTKGLIVGIERDGDRILNPESSTVFMANDIIFMVASKQLIASVLKQAKEKINDF